MFAATLGSRHHLRPTPRLPSRRPVCTAGPSAQTAADSDGDGLPDAWEIQYGLRPDNANGVNGANGDPDRDGLINGDEYANGTDPRKADTDGDSLPDLWEVENLTDPLAAGGDVGPNGDPDGDGLLNKDELRAASIPSTGTATATGCPTAGRWSKASSPTTTAASTAPKAFAPAVRKPTTTGSSV